MQYFTLVTVELQHDPCIFQFHNANHGRRSKERERGRQEARSAIGGGLRENACKDAIVFAIPPPNKSMQNPESCEMSGCQNDPIRIALLCHSSCVVLPFLVFLAYFEKMAEYKNIKVWKRQKEVA